MIVGFTGNAGAGKDTAAQALPNAQQLAFAKPLKDACQILFDFTDDQLYDPIQKEVVDPRWGKSPRQIMQWLGTDVLRKQFRDDFFLFSMKCRMESANGKDITITDARFDNEAEFVRKEGGTITRIIRNKKEGSGTKHSQHDTELGISEHLVDYVVENNSSIEELHKNVLNNIRKNIV